MHARAVQRVVRARGAIKRDLLPCVNFAAQERPRVNAARRREGVEVGEFGDPGTVIDLIEAQSTIVDGLAVAREEQGG